MTPVTPTTIFFVGDLILDEPNPDSFFDLARATLQSADLVIGHVEVPHTMRGVEQSSDVPAPPANPEHLAALARANFHVATLAGNHMFDQGTAGVADTIAALRAENIVTVGAGMNLNEARQPAIIERNGLRIGVLSYNCVGPRDSWAKHNKAGVAYLHVLTHYELNYATPGGPPTIYTFAEPDSLEAMQADVESLRSQVDVLTVAFHKGVAHTPALIAMYERQVAKAAIDAGADIVVGHHAHILRGIETYKGKPIFHGLGNFVTVTRALNIENNASPERLAWAKRRRELFGFEPDPDYPTYPFHSEAKNAVIAFCEVSPTGVTRAGFIPCWITPSGQPEVLTRNDRGEAVAAYVAQITAKAGLKGTFEWEGERVFIKAAKARS
ncbi:MAG: CapA family protein [Acidobacteria bacterium]|nr:CapA family protein [Acidobacteriota bacterium]